MNTITLIVIVLAVAITGFCHFRLADGKEKVISGRAERIRTLNELPGKDNCFCYEIKEGLYMNLSTRAVPADGLELKEQIDFLLRTDPEQKWTNNYTSSCNLIVGDKAEETHRLGELPVRMRYRDRLMGQALQEEAGTISVQIGQLVAEEPLVITLQKEDKDGLFLDLVAHVNKISKHKVLAYVQHSDNIDEPFQIGILLAGIS